MGDKPRMRFSMKFSMKKWMKHSLLAAAAACSCVLVFGIASSGTQSYLQSKDSAVNRFTVGNVETEIVEPEFEPSTEPNKPHKKVVQIKSTGENPCYVRVRVLPASNPDKFEFNFDTSNWTRDGNGVESWWYYNKILQPGETTEPLFTTYTITEDLSNEPADNLQIYVYEESTQSEGYDDAKSAFGE